MRKVFIIAVFAAIVSAAPALACKTCGWHYYYPQSQWGEECAYCDDSDCGWIICVIEQGSDPNDGDNCVMDGAGCDDRGSGYCPPPSVSRLDTNWRLTHVHVVTKTAQRPASVRFGKKG